MAQIDTHLGQKIKKLRELKNLTQSYVASELGISQSAYSKMEVGETEVSYSKLSRIASIFGMAPEEITSFNEQMVFNVMNNQTGNGFVLNNGMTQNEKKLYEDQITQMKEEIAYLKKILDTLINK